MRTLFLTIIIFYFTIACSPSKMVVDATAWYQKEELPVKGRNGFLSNQKLSFGEFQTTKVQRSWTKGSSWAFNVPVANDWVERLNIESVQRKQNVRFCLADGNGNKSEVTAYSKVSWTDLSIGNNPNSVINIIGELLQIGVAGLNNYAVRILTSNNVQPWEMLIDNNATQRQAKIYTGLLAKSKDDYYTIVPVYKLLNKKGKSVALPFGGSVGFEFRNQKGDIVAAVSLIDNGIVYFNQLDKNEKFLLANAATALLLQQQLD